jgi:uncharacterized protein YjcR
MTIKRKAGGRPTNRPPKEQLAMLYSSMTAQEIATYYGVSVATVRSWIARYRKEDNNMEVLIW